MRISFLCSCLLFSALSILGCKTKKQAVKQDLNETIESSKNDEGPQRNSYLSGKGNMEYRDGERSLSLSIRSRTCLDSAIWVSLSMLGIEALRAIICRDSVQVLNRISKKFEAVSFDSLSVVIGFPASYSQIESLLFGIPRPVVPELVTNEHVMLEYKTEYDSTGSCLMMIGSFLRNKEGQELLTSEYGKHESKGSFCLPQRAKFAGTVRDSIALEIDWISLDTTSRVDMPFQIPQGYERGH